jgi:hypothetical protein
MRRVRAPDIQETTAKLNTTFVPTRSYSDVDGFLGVSIIDVFPVRFAALFPAPYLRRLLP